MTRSDSEIHHKPNLKVLSEEQIEQIHMATMEVLERTGVRITHPKALDLMEGAGGGAGAHGCPDNPPQGPGLNGRRRR
jgi:trimethylamine:corrinoid methyltransferase-like protein